MSENDSEQEDEEQEGEDFQTEVGFADLPPFIIEMILKFLPLKSLINVSLLNSQFKTYVCSSLRDTFFDLDSKIMVEMESVGEKLKRIPTDEDTVLLRLPYFRSYFILEMLKSEMSIFKAVDKKELYGKSESILSMVQLLHLYEGLYIKAKYTAVVPWNLNDGYSMSLAKLTRRYLERTTQDEADDEYFGSRIFEILDASVNKFFKINMRFIPYLNTCSIDATYKISQLQFMNPPPKLKDGNNMVPSSEDKKNIISFLINLVRTNNRITLRDEQYFRELEGTRGTQAHEFLYGAAYVEVPRSRHLSCNVRPYNSIPDAKRKISFQNGLYEIEEELKNIRIYREGQNNHGGTFKCKITMTCSMESCPQLVSESWRRFKNELFDGSLSSEPLWISLTHHLRHECVQSMNLLGTIKSTTQLNCSIDITSSLFQSQSRDISLRFKEP